MPRSKHRSPGAGRRLMVLAGVGLLALLGAVLVGAAFRPPPTPASHFVDTAPGAQAAAGQRTVVVARAGEALPHLSADPTILMTHLVSGQLPDGVAQAIVRTDSNCQPDQDGVSHCLNELAIGSTTVVVQHHHRMSEVPCLTPGERVTIVDLEHYKQL